jgi:AMP-binding enzyme
VIPLRYQTCQYNLLEVTFLAILAHEAIALPLSPAFPASELRHVLENSGAKIFRFTSSLASKAEEALDDKLRTSPLLSMAQDGKREPILEEEKIEIDRNCIGGGGIMLYTSGTTSRPVCYGALPRERKHDADHLAERCTFTHISHYSPIQIINRSMEVYEYRSFVTPIASPSYPWCNQWASYTAHGWFRHRVPLSIQR